MTSDDECFVYIVPPGTTRFVTAARFRVSKSTHGSPIGELVYGRRYLERPDAVELDPVELKLGHRSYETARMNGVFGAIRDAAPDSWGRHNIERNIGSTNLGECDYLLQGPDDRAGALGFGLSAVPPAPRRHFSLAMDLEALHYVAQSTLNYKGDGPRTLLLEGTSMGGARPKAVIEANGALWIAKFCSHEDRWSHPRVEHALLNLARLCGIQVAHSKITTVGGNDVLLVRRFDRDLDENGYCRHRMVSALTLLRSDDSPDSQEAWSYLLLADEIRRTSGSPTKDLRELFARMCFNALVSNTDDHPRNHALLAKDRTWRLSPAYDLTPTPSTAMGVRSLAMICGSYGRMARRDNLLTAAGRFLLSLEEATTLVDDMIDIVRAEWGNSLRRAGASAYDCAAVSSACLYSGFFLPST